MDKLDRMIEAALAEEDRAILEETQELGFFTQFTRQLAGPNAWVNWLSHRSAIFVYVGARVLGRLEGLRRHRSARRAIKWGLLAAVSGSWHRDVQTLSCSQKMQTDRIIRQFKRRRADAGAARRELRRAPSGRAKGSR